MTFRMFSPWICGCPSQPPGSREGARAWGAWRLLGGSGGKSPIPAPARPRLPQLRGRGPEGPVRRQQRARCRLKPHFSYFFQIILWRKAARAAAHVQPERIRTVVPQLSRTVGKGLGRPLVPSRTGTGVGGHGSGSAIPLPSWCHLVPGEQGQSRSRPLCCGKWSKNKLPLHLFPVKRWTVVCTVTSGPLASPTRVTDCTKSSYKALSGMAAVAGTQGQIPTQRPLTQGGQKSRQSSPGGAQALVPTQDAKPRQPRMWHWDFTHTTQWICGWCEGGSCRNLPLESGLGHTEPSVRVHPLWCFKYTSVVRPIHSQSISSEEKTEMRTPCWSCATPGPQPVWTEPCCPSAASATPRIRFEP